MPKTMNIRDHIEAGHYPKDEKGRALVPMRGGGMLTILATDVPGKQPIVGWSEYTDAEQWTPEGKFHSGCDPATSDCDLLPPPPRKVKVTGWGARLSNGAMSCLIEGTREQAAKHGTPVELTGEYEEPWS